MAETIDIEINPKLNALDKSELTACKSQLQELEDNFLVSKAGGKDFLSDIVPNSMSEFTKAMSASIAQQYKAIVSQMKTAAIGESISTEMMSGLKEGIAFLSANLETLFSSTGSIGKVFSNIPKTMTAAFNREFTDLSKTASSLLGRTYKSMGQQTDSALMAILNQNAPFRKGSTAFASKFGLNQSQMNDILKGVIQYVSPVINREDYVRKVIDSSRGAFKKYSVMPEYTSYKDRLPKEFRNLPNVPQSTSFTTGSKRKAYQGNLTNEQYNVVRSVAAKYQSFENALVMAGVAKRGVLNGKAGQLIMPSKPISEAEYAAALGFLDRDIMRKALEGAPMYRHSLLNSDDHAQMAMARKTSRIPTESFAAFNELKGIPVRTPLYLNKPRKYTRSAANSSTVDSALQIRPDAYQIMSLTLDDFAKGVILKDKPDTYYSYSDKAAGKSINRMINRSTYTDLLGMSGHNTHGSTSGPRRMIQLDLTDRVFEKDSTGKVVFENGKPKANAETMRFVEALFDTKNGKTITTPGGKTFSYPVIQHGKNGTYVPTGIHKSGVIDLAEETAYVKAASKFIDKYGLDVFQNLVSPDEEFSTVSGLNKPIDARNRLHTPSVPLSTLGGKMPNKRQVGFVDLESVMGLNGAAMFMPGYLPAQALTLRSVGFKGAGFNADFKKMIRDVYGDVGEFLVPAWNAPDEMKKLYNEKGVNAVKEAYKKQGLKTFNEDFVDIMKMEALIDASLNKTPFYKGKSHSQIQDMFFDVADMIGGIRGVSTDTDFLSKSSTISRQVVQNLDLSQADIAANKKKWNEYINTLRTNPAKTRELLFSDPNNPLDQRIAKDPSLQFSDPEAIQRVSDAIIAAENDRDNQKLFAKGDALNALAVANPFEIISAVAKRNGYRVKNRNLANVLSLNKKGNADAVALAAWADTEEMGGWRYPNNVGEQFELYNSKEFIDLLDEYGISRNAMIMNMDTIKKMGGGDVDGDTVQAVRRRLAEIVKRTYETRGADTAKLNTTVNKAGDLLLEGGPRKISAADFAENFYRKAASVFEMAAVSNAGDALAQGNWLDKDWANFAKQAGVDLRAMYDIDTTYAKTGVLAAWSHNANKARKLGTPYVSMFKNIFGAIESNDFSRVKDFSQVNFPSRYSNLTASTLAAGMDTPYSNSMLETFINMQEALQGIDKLEKSGNPADLAKAAYLRKNNSLFGQIVSNRAQIVSTKDQNELLALWSNWSNLVSDEYNRPGITEAQKEYWKNQLHDVTFQRSRLDFLKEFGITEDARNRREGYIPVSGLAKGYLTGETSDFYSNFNAEQDAIRAKQVMISGADAQITDLQREAAEKSRIAEQLNLANNREYSWSQLHTIEKSADGPLKWYKNYIVGNKDATTPMMLMGSAFHEAAESWANRRMKNNQDYGTAEEYEEFINNYLLKWEDEKTGQKLFTELPTKDSKLFDDRVKQRYNAIISAARMLPEFLKDEEIIGAEKNGGEVHPNIGIDQNGKRLNSVGYIDLVSRNPKTGAVTNWDFKEGWEHDKSLEYISPVTGATHRYDQPTLYAGANNANRVGIIGYGNGKLEPESVPVTPEMIKDVEGRMANITKNIIAVSGQPDIYSAIRNGAFDSLALPTVYKPQVQSYQAGTPLAVNPYVNFAMAEGLPIVAMAEEAAANDAPAKMNEEDLAKLFHNRQKINDAIGTFEQLRGKFSAMERGYDPKRKGIVSSQWDQLNFQMSSANYADMARQLKDFGASDADIALFANSYDLAKEGYDKALRAGAVGDFDRFSENIAERLLTRNTTSSARSILHEQKEIDRNIELARSAYDVLNAKPEKTKEDEKALEDAQKRLDAAYEIKDKYEEALTKEAEDVLGKDILNFVSSAKGPSSNKNDKLAASVANFNMQKDKLTRSLDNLYTNEKISDEEYKRLSGMLSGVTEEDYRNRLQQQMQIAQNREDLRLSQTLRQGDQMRRHMFGRGRGFVARALDQRDSNLTQWENRKQYLDEQITAKENTLDSLKKEGKGEGDKEYDKVAGDLVKLRSASDDAGRAIAQLTDPMATAMAVTSQFGDVVGRLAQRLGRQLFHKALQETKRFVKEFDASMNEIQAITLKSNEEMQGIRSQTIDKALGLKTSVSNVANVEAALYRQGLSDAEVSSRTESIIKFATVTKLNVQEATKIITTALQNDLVSSAQEAMDALVALGDSAATTAAEIGKGMQKAAAAAKVAGVSYSELTALLTIGTSDTQLSGTQVGTALQTVFTRMRRLSLNKWVADQNGEKTTSSDAEAALASVGVDLWDDKSIGKMRTAYEVLSDLSKVWQNLSDAQKNIVMNAMAGTRQTNVFATLMEGMSEDNGATLDKYLGLAENSEGITQTKYEIAMQSLSAAMDELKSSWDALVESFISGSNITNILDGFSGFLQMFTNAGQIGQGLSVITGGIAALAVAMTALSSSSPALKALSAILGVVAGFGAGGLVSFVSSGINELTKSESDKLSEKASAQSAINNGLRQTRENRIVSNQKIIKEVRELGKAYDEIQNKDTESALVVGLQKLAVAFPEVSDAILESIQNLNNWRVAVKDAEDAANNYTNNNKRLTFDTSLQHLRQYSENEYNKSIGSIVQAEDVAQARNAISKFAFDEFGTFLFGKDNNFINENLSNLNNDQKVAIAKELYKNYSTRNALTGYMQQVGLYDLWQSVYKGQANDVEKGQVVSALPEMFDVFSAKSAYNNPEAYNAKIKQASYSFAKEYLLGNLPIDLMATNEYGEDFVRKLLENTFVNELVSNDAKYFENGKLNNSKAIDYLKTLVDDWYVNPAGFIQNLVSKAPDELFEYFLGEGNNKQRFLSYEEAKEAVDLSNGRYQYSQIVDKNGKSAYQTVDQLIAAQMQQADTGNQQRTIQKILYGYQHGEDTSTLAEIASGGRRPGENTGAYQRRKHEIEKQIKQGNYDFSSLMPGGIDQFKDFESFKEAYAGFNLDSDLANVLMGSPEALVGYLTGNLGLIKSGLITSLNGQATPQNTALGMQMLMSTLASNKDFASAIMTDKTYEAAYKNIQSYFGDNADNILNAMMAGTYSGSEYQKLVQDTIASKGIALGVGNKFTNVETANLAQRVLSSDVANLAAAQAGLGWNTDQWDALQNKYPDLIRYLEMTPEQQQSQEGQNLLRNVEIQISVAGVSDLEQANKVLQGTSDLISGLGGSEEQAIKAKVNFGNTLFSNRQQEALLYNGSEKEQIDTIAAITGLSPEQIQQNPEGARTLADTLIGLRNDQIGASLDEIAKEHPELAAEFASIYGYTLNTRGNYVATDEVVNPLRANLAYGTSVSRNGVQIARNRQSVINETLSSTVGNYEEYQEAYNALGEHGKNYMAMLQHRERYTDDELAAAKALATSENDIALREAEDQLALDQARLGTTTVGGVFSYARQQYNQSNKALIAANNLFEAFTDVEPDDVDALMSIMSNDKYRNDWEDLLDSAPELTKEFQDAGHAVTEDGQIDWNVIKEQEGSLDDALADLIRIISSHSSDLEGIAYDTRSDIYSNAQDYLTNGTKDDYDDYAAVVGQDIAARERAKDYSLNDLEQWYRDTRLGNYGNGIDGLTTEDRVSGAGQIIEQIKNGTYDTNTSADVISDISGTVEGLGELTQAYLKLDKSSNNYNERLEVFNKILNDVEASLASSKKAATGWGEANQKVAKSIEQLNKGGVAERKELGRLTEEAKDYQDTVTAASKSAGKTGKQIVKDKTAVKQFGKIGFNEDEIKSWTQAEAEEYSKLLLDYAQEAFTQENLPAVLQQAMDTLNAQPIELRPTLEMITDVNGDLDFSKLAAVLAQYDAALAAAIEKYNGILAEAHIRVQSTNDGQGNGDVFVVANSSLKSAKLKSGGGVGGGGYNHNAGGGGGGKSEIDKLLERQKYTIGSYEHQGKILEAMFQGYDFVNDYGAMNANIDEQIANQESLRAAYAANIAELQAQLATVEQGSDDWYKLTDAINSAQEAMANINNTINQLRSTKITILEQKQEYEKGPIGHKGTMLEKRAQRYQLTGNFQAYEQTVQQSIGNYKDEIGKNNEQIKEWEALLKQTVKGSDDWYKIRDKIWGLKEENEQLQNDAIQAQIELDKARVDEIAKQMQLATMGAEHANAMLDTFAGMYESVFDYKHYREALNKQADNLEKMKKANEDAIEDLKAQIEKMAEDDPARQYALQMLYQLEEQNAQLQAEMLANQQSIEESYISEIKHNYEERENNIAHEGKLLEEELKKHQRNHDYLNEENIYKEQARNIDDEIDLQKAKLTELENLLNSGKITEGSQQWFELQQMIQEVTESIAALENQYVTTTDKLKETQFNHITSLFNEGYNYTGGETSHEMTNDSFVGMDQLQHEMNLLGYEQTRYQNRGELTNVGKTLGWERERILQQRDATARQIDILESFKETVRDVPDLYDKVTDEIRKQEEALQKYQNELEKTDEAIKKNQEAIRQARMKVENEADKALRSIIQKQKTMLSATVSLQNTIIETIRNNYKEQWDLEKKTIEKKKQALNEEKNILNERLNFRKRMMDQEAKDEELAEYKRQLAMISADTTRTKDANELRRKIAEMEKEQAIQTAEDITKAEIQSIDDRLQAWTDYVTVQEEDLNNMLSNANNFTDVINQLLSGSFEDFLAWNEQMNKDYKNKTDEQRKQIADGWKDTWDGMLGNLKTYWDEVDAATRSKEGFLALLMSTDEYNSKSETGKESYLQNAEDLWDAFYNSTVDTATFSDEHDVLTTLNSMQDWTFKVNLSNPEELALAMGYSNYAISTPNSDADPIKFQNYNGWGVSAPAPAPNPAPPSGGGGGGGGGGTSSPPAQSAARWAYRYTYGGNTRDERTTQTTYNGAYNAGLSEINSILSSKINALQKQYPYMGTVYDYEYNKIVQLINAAKSSLVAYQYKAGGLVDYTGPAWVDGTKAKPESFLNADDTALLRSMLDSFTYVKTAPYITHPGESSFGTGGINIGDVNVNLYEAKLENDADYDLIAKKVGNAFTKELQKTGFNLAQYAW